VPIIIQDKKLAMEEEEKEKNHEMFAT